jgi:photosystem II stability/assembly factor-like uncharacterized protein
MGLSKGIRFKVAKSAIFILLTILIPTNSAHADSFSSFSNLNQNGIGFQDFQGVASSYSGSVLYAVVNYGYIYQSTDSGTTWNTLLSAGSRAWSAVATNDSGTVIYAAVSGSLIYKSLDSGATWNSIPAAGSRSWNQLATSATGSVVAGTYADSTIQVSTDGGTNWASRVPAGSQIKGLTMSGDGTRIAVQSTSTISLSSNSGANWTSYTNVVAGTNSSISTISMSRDGQKVFTVGGPGVNDDKVHFTQNFGTLWETSTAAPLASGWYSNVKVSGDGNRVVVTTSSSRSYSSTDNGANWTGTVVNLALSAVTMDYAGTRVVATSANYSSATGIYISTSPFTWVTKTFANGYTRLSRVEMSANGNKIVAINYYGDVWVSSDAGATWFLPTGISAGNKWNCVAMSSDGSRIVLGGQNIPPLMSSNGGTSFSGLSLGSATYYGCAMSADGTKIAFSHYTSGVMVSVNSGTSFSSSLPNSFNSNTYNYGSIVMSADGNKMAVLPTQANAPVIVWKSTDTWTATSGGVSASSTTGVLKASADGSVLISASSYATSQTAPRISTNWGSSWSPLPSNVGNLFSDAISVSQDGGLIVMGQYSSNGGIFQSVDGGSSFTAISGAPTGFHSSLAINSLRSQLIGNVVGQQLYKSTFVTLQAASFQSLSLSTGSVAPFRTQVTLSAQLTLAGSDGKVTFQANGKNIPGCIKVNSISLSATCTWSPSIRGAVILSAISYPTSSNFFSSSIRLPVAVGKRTGLR